MEMVGVDAAKIAPLTVQLCSYLVGFYIFAMWYAGVIH